MSHLESYLRALAEAQGPGVPETSGYGPLQNLLNSVGDTITPKVRCIIHLQNEGAGIPDGGLFTAGLLRKNPDAKPLLGLLPDRGAIEVKPISADAWVTAKGAQVSKYWQKYGYVLVTNYRDFVMVGRDTNGKPVVLGTYRLADNEKVFWQAAHAPRAAAAVHSGPLTEYLKRVLLHAPAYRAENSGALRQDWPRVPLPSGKAALTRSADLGRAIAALHDTERPVPRVTEGVIRAEFKQIAVFTVPKGRPLDEDTDFAVTAGWGNAGKGGISMPGKGKVVERDGALEIYLNAAACWRNVPVPVWEYTLGGYQVMKKWLSYRESKLLGRSLKLDEVKEMTNMARRIAAILGFHQALDANFSAVKGPIQ